LGFVGRKRQPHAGIRPSPTEETTVTKPNDASIVREATFIRLQAAAGQEKAVAELLSGAAPLIRKTEPLTLQWMALKDRAGGFAIADFFRDDSGRAAHFGGQVAAALKQAAPTAVQGGWEKGVVANVENSQVLSSTITADHSAPPTLAVRIDLKAAPGQEEALAAFLTGGANLVQATEPGTLLWYALRIGKDRFVIFDLFANEAGQAAHFGGQVAAALKGKAPELISGGWEGGVLSGIQNFTVLSATY
jgi:quinol monooxygenase YgiN